MAHQTLGTFPDGTIRLSMGYFNTLADIDATVKNHSSNFSILSKPPAQPIEWVKDRPDAGRRRKTSLVIFI
jgi:hypothetical protein